MNQGSIITPPNLPLSQGEGYTPSWVKRGEGGVTPIDSNRMFIAEGAHPNYETVDRCTVRDEKLGTIVFILRLKGMPLSYSKVLIMQPSP
jgi:hypothetical protein